MSETQAGVVLTGDGIDWSRQVIIGSYVENSRCGASQMIVAGTIADHLGCTRRPGHAGKHRIFMRRVGQRGRKHVKWVEPALMVGWYLAT